MRYKVNARCTRCGTAYSYWNDDPSSAKMCPHEYDPDHWPNEQELRELSTEEWQRRRRSAYRSLGGDAR